MKKLLSLIAALLLATALFAETYTIKVTGTATKKTEDGEYVELEGECFIDDEDILYLEEGSMVTFTIGKKTTTIKGPKSPIKFGDLLIKLKLK